MVPPRDGLRPRIHVIRWARSSAVEHRTFNAVVGGSIPPGLTKFPASNARESQCGYRGTQLPGWPRDAGHRGDLGYWPTADEAHILTCGNLRIDDTP